MGLINRKQRDLLSADRLQEPFVVESFGGYVEKFQRPGVEFSACLFRLVLCERGIHPRGGYPAASQVIDLVFHKSDERRDHQRDAIPHERRQLVTKRLAAARWKYCQCSPVVTERPNDFPLPGTKFRISKLVDENSVGLDHAFVKSVRTLSAEKIFHF